MDVVGRVLVTYGASSSTRFVMTNMFSVKLHTTQLLLWRDETRANSHCVVYYMHPHNTVPPYDRRASCPKKLSMVNVTIRIYNIIYCYLVNYQVLVVVVIDISHAQHTSAARGFMGNLGPQRTLR